MAMQDNAETSSYSIYFSFKMIFFVTEYLLGFEGHKKLQNFVLKSSETR